MMGDVCRWKDVPKGVAVIVDNNIAKKVAALERHGDRIIIVKVKAEPVVMVLVQVYMPTSDHEDEEIEKLYDELEGILARKKGTYKVVIMGDWNAVVGEEQVQVVVGMFGLGQRHKAEID